MSRIATLSPAEPHSFRRHVRFQVLKQTARRRAVLSAQDVREFLMAYCTCFLAVSAFIA